MRLMTQRFAAGHACGPSFLVNTRELLREADFAPLLMSHVQLSGESEWLARCQPHITGAWCFNEAVPTALRETVIERLAARLEAIGSGAILPAPDPDPALLRQMMEVCAGQPIPDEYLPLVTHDMGLAATPPIEVDWRTPPSPRQLADHPVVVIGAGGGGLCMGKRLREAGIEDFVILDKASGVHDSDA